MEGRAISSAFAKASADTVVTPAWTRQSDGFLPARPFGPTDGLFLPAACLPIGWAGRVG
jgi:hypothetical protein